MTHLKLFFLGVPFHSFSSRWMPHKGHYPDSGFMVVEHFCNFLDTLSVRWEDHDPSIFWRFYRRVLPCKTMKISVMVLIYSGHGISSNSQHVLGAQFSPLHQGVRLNLNVHRVERAVSMSALHKQSEPRPVICPLCSAGGSAKIYGPVLWLLLCASTVSQRSN